MSDRSINADLVDEMTVDAVRDHNDAVDERITELERKVSRWKARYYGDKTSDDDEDRFDRTDRGQLDLRSNTD